MIIQVHDISKDYYAISCQGSSVKKPKGGHDNTFLRLLNTIIAKSRSQFPEFYMHDYSKNFIDDPAGMHIYLISKANDDVVGHVMGTLSSGDENIIINQVEVSVKYRNQHVCSKLLLPGFIKITGNRTTYSLINTAGDNSCKCYQNAFKRMGYSFNKDCSDIVMKFTKS